LKSWAVCAAAGTKFVSIEKLGGLRGRRHEVRFY